MEKKFDKDTNEEYAFYSSHLSYFKFCNCLSTVNFHLNCLYGWISHNYWKSYKNTTENGLL